MKKESLFALLLAAAAGCNDQASISATSQALVQDAVHNGGRVGFYFLLPLVEATMLPPTFDPSLSLHARLEDTAGAPVASIALTAGSGSYQAMLDTNALALHSSVIYRLRVFAGALELGYADMRVYPSQQVARSMATEEFFELVDGDRPPTSRNQPDTQ